MSITIAVIGGGASGMMAALTAVKRSNQVLLCEKNPRPGKKLLATGNGRCNITNTDVDISNYHGENPAFALPALKRFGPADTLGFFSMLGLVCKTTHGGRVYPYSEQAGAVLDTLRNAITHSPIRLCVDTDIVRAESNAQGFVLHARTGETHRCDRLIIATGGKAAPSTGSDGSGFELLRSLGHRIIEPYPALAQLKTDSAPMKGVRLQGSVTVNRADAPAAVSDGEIQFTDHGLSGPAIMSVSAYAVPGTVIAIDMLPHLSERELGDMLVSRREQLAHLNAEDFLTGMLNKRAGHVALKRVGVKLTQPVGSLSTRQLHILARTIKSLSFTVLGHTGWEHAQATGGGADTAEFNAATMESAIIKGLYATGEVLDIYGDCGGYNLQWAWATGHVAGMYAST